MPSRAATWRVGLFVEVEPSRLASATAMRAVGSVLRDYFAGLVQRPSGSWSVQHSGEWLSRSVAWPEQQSELGIPAMGCYAVIVHRGLDGLLAQLALEVAEG